MMVLSSGRQEWWAKTESGRTTPFTYVVKDGLAIRMSDVDALFSYLSNDEECRENIVSMRMFRNGDQDWWSGMRADT